MSVGVAVGSIGSQAAVKVTTRKWLTWAPILLADTTALLLAGVSAVFLRHSRSSLFQPSDYLPFVPAIGLFILMFSVAGLYPGIGLNPVQELRRIVSSVTAVYLILLAATFFLHVSGDYSRLIFLMAWAVSVTLVVIFRNVARDFLGKQPWWGTPVVILGTGETARTVARTLLKHASLGLKVIAMLDDGGGETDPRSLPAPLLGDISMAPMLAATMGVHYAILAMSSVRGAEFSSAIARYADTFDHVLIIPDFLNLSSLWVSAKDLGGILGLEVSQTLAQRRPQIFKRAFDLITSVIGGVLILPVIGLIYVAIRANSPGAVFYSQKRIGKNNQPFHVWKFRTMVANADAVLRAHLESDPELKEEWNLNRKLRKDPRITLVGRFLRKTSLDELPQIWNILRGDMSLVGPRPIVQDEIRLYGGQFDLYGKVRPGITGLWQVSGRNHTTYEERVQYDSYYVRNWSIWLDLFILGRTVRTVLAREGAY
jgi:Undecaprenyl-phosphate galactose phosphotransferase WbaP